MVSYVFLFLMIRMDEGATIKGLYYNVLLLDLLYLILSMSLYFSFNILIFRWMIRKVNLSLSPLIQIAKVIF